MSNCPKWFTTKQTKVLFPFTRVTTRVLRVAATIQKWYCKNRMECFCTQVNKWCQICESNFFGFNVSVHMHPNAICVIRQPNCGRGAKLLHSDTNLHWLLLENQINCLQFRRWEGRKSCHSEQGKAPRQYEVHPGRPGTPLSLGSSCLGNAGRLSEYLQQLNNWTYFSFLFNNWRLIFIWT